MEEAILVLSIVVVDREERRAQTMVLLSNFRKVFLFATEIKRKRRIGKETKCDQSLMIPCRLPL